MQQVSMTAVRRFVQQETPLAMRVITARGGAPQASAVRKIKSLLEEEAARGLELRAPADLLAYAITRIGEGFIYNEAIADTQVQGTIDRHLAPADVLALFSVSRLHGFRRRRH